MKKLNKIPAVFIMVLVLVSVGNNISAQQVPSKLIQAFQEGDADALAPHFNERFQLVLLGVDHRVSKAQAKEIMREFFKKNQVVSFEIIHKGVKKDSNFAVGKLTTKTDTYRVNLFFKKVDEQSLLHLLEIEKDNDTTF